MATPAAEGSRRALTVLALCLLLFSLAPSTADADWCHGYKNIFQCLKAKGEKACEEDRFLCDFVASKKAKASTSMTTKP